ncbi:MAG: DUF692 domain-containing protein [Curvibacter sp.]|nr:DUF692 domain-containing protein [Curvibacter sp.]
MTDLTPAQARALTGVGWRQPHYGELLERRPELGFLEVHSENFFAAGGAALGVLLRGREHYPVSLHGVGLSLGSARGLDAWHLDQLADLVERVDPVRVSDHASFARADLHGQSVHAADLLPVPWTWASLAVMARQVEQVQERLRRPLAIENLSAYLQWPAQDMGEVDFLVELCRRTGCHLLVDVNNLHVNALNAWRREHGGSRTPATAELLAPSLAWLAAVPGERVAEIHLAGHCDTGSLVIDDHGSRVSDDVWQLYRHALAQWGPKPTLLEWDTQVPALSVLLAEAGLAADAMAACGRREEVAA